MDKDTAVEIEIDLRCEPLWIAGYVRLRNFYAKQLLTGKVTEEETKKWLERTEVEVRCIVKNSVLIGVVLLYLNKGGEITFFAAKKKAGIGHRLLRIIENVACERGISSIWAWTRANNFSAQRAFEKNSFTKKASIRHAGGIPVKGYTYQKKIKH